MLVSPVSDSTLDRAAGALGIVNPELDPVAVPEIELSEIAVKVPLRAMLIDADHAALKNREVALDGIGVRVAAYPFLFAVIDGFVAGEATADRAVHVSLIGAEIAGGVGVLQDDLAHFAGSHGLDLDRAGLAAALNEGDDLPLVAIGALPLPAEFPDARSRSGHLQRSPGKSRPLQGSCLHRRADRSRFRPSLRGYDAR